MTWFSKAPRNTVPNGKKSLSVKDLETYDEQVKMCIIKKKQYELLLMLRIKVSLLSFIISSSRYLSYVLNAPMNEIELIHRTSVSRIWWLTVCAIDGIVLDGIADQVK